MRRRHLRSIAVAAVVGLMLTGCGTSSDPLGSVRSAAKLTLSQSTEEAVMLRGGSVFPGRSVPLDARAAFVFPTGLGYAALVLPAADRRPPGTVYLDFAPGRLDVAPVERTLLPAGRLWVALGFSRRERLHASAAALALTLEALDPEILLTEIVDGAVRASSLGERVIAHVPYAEYEVSVDLARARSASCAVASSALCAAESAEETAAAHSGGRHTETVEIAVWADGQGRIVQLRAALPGSGWGSVLITLSNFGVAIPRSQPLASQVVDLTSLERSGWSLSVASLLTGSPTVGAG